MAATTVASGVLTLTACAAEGEHAGGASDHVSPGRPSGPPGDPSSSESLTSAEQGDIYDEALRRWNDYRRHSIPVMASGRATAQSERVFKEYFLDWQVQQNQLRGLEQNGITSEGPASVAWSRPASVTPETVTIEECVAAEATLLQNGEELPPAGPRHPYLLSIVLSRSPSGGDFKIESATPMLDVRCDTRER